MTRPSRHAVLGDGPAFVHLITRFHNGEFLLAHPNFKTALRRLLLEAKHRFHVRIHHYCFMDSHIHLISSFDSTDDHSKFMHSVFFRLAQKINRHFHRKGHVFLDRPKTPVIQSGKRMLLTMRYIDLNPVRAKMVRKAHHYSWSSYRYYAYGEKDDLIDPVPDYQGLSRVPALRRKLYRELVGAVSNQGDKRLPEMSTWYFIGDVDWVMKKLREGGFLHQQRPPS